MSSLPENFNDNSNLCWHFRIFLQLNDAFSLVTFVGLFCSCMILVMYCFMGMNLFYWNDYVQYFFGALSTILELFIQCWFSQKMCECVRNDQILAFQINYFYLLIVSSRFLITECWNRFKRLWKWLVRQKFDVQKSNHSDYTTKSTKNFIKSI